MSEYITIVDKGSRGTRKPRKSQKKSSRSSAVQRLRAKAPITLQQSNLPSCGSGGFGNDSLWNCQSVDEVRQWLANKQAKFLEKAAKGFGRSTVSEETRRGVDALLNQPGATSVFIMTDGHLVLETFDLLRNLLHAYAQADPEIEFALVTFISGDGGTSLDKPVIELWESQKRVKSTLRAMAANWFGMTELAFFNSITHPDGGRHLQRHEHALIFGRGVVERAERVAINQSPNYPPNVTDARVIDVRPALNTTEVNLARLAAYLLKAPAKAMNWCPPRDDKPGFMNQSEKGDRPIRFLRLAQLLSMLTFEDLVFGGGDGRDIKSSIVGSTRGLAAAGARGQRQFHPDAIPAFWVEVAKELKRTQWTLPVIQRQ